MQITAIHDLANVDLEAALQRLPFFRKIRASSESQFKQLMGFCRIVEMGSDEVILRRGDKSTWLYFLLRGELLVFADTDEDEAPVNHILPGEMFGDLALIGDSERQATVCSSPSGSGVRLFACDASCFGMLEDDYPVSLETKLIFYRMMTDSVRWKLEKNRMAQPQHELSKRMISLPVFRGVKDGLEELHALVEQTIALADILLAWNSETNASASYISCEEKSAI
ncbi:hypothetical protein SIN8267_02384 [Sinobacterium norvegicum]|uniref:Cyclic nucleotide-binding domain-containing protein n=1 Tax=Sinobacterium norvegicum TaxID=1641715 RepID=A0ABM9AHM7_9GAMM|nr:cyclic nucleotide-binding domain-containing protein [Sinobacterium norvegicum]CAH0992265.1 hypothetical protein SIN8267_02384 [Sinobacterium norvegicum]